MSAVMQTRPKAGDRVRAHITYHPKSGEVADITLPDGSMVLTNDEVALFGDGDAVEGRKQIRLMISMEKDRTVFSGPTDKPSIGRWPEPKDEAALMALLLLDVAENAERVAPANEERIRGHIELVTRDKLGLGWVIDGPDGKPVATCLLVPNQWWWSVQYFYQELVLYVHPDHRRSRHIYTLMQFQRWAVDTYSKSFGYRVHLLCGVLGVNKVREKIALYRRNFRQVGIACLYPSPFERDRP